MNFSSELLPFEITSFVLSEKPSKSAISSPDLDGPARNILDAIRILRSRCSVDTQSSFFSE